MREKGRNARVDRQMRMRMIERRRVAGEGRLRADPVEGRERRATAKRQVNHTERSLTYLHVMARLGLDNEISHCSAENGD